MKDKLVFVFTLSDGVSRTDVESVRDTPFYERVVQKEKAFYSKNSMYEEEWVLSELRNTDYMLLEDATYKGTSLSEAMIEDVKRYRSALRNYQWRTKEPRPLRPSWYTTK